MITQSIEVHKSTYQGHTNPVHWQQQREPNPNAPYANAQPMDKLAYAKYLGQLGYGKGDFVCFAESQKAHGSPQFTKWQVSFIADVIEIHHMVSDWGTNKSGPRCVNVLNYGSGATPTQGGRLIGPTLNGANLYKKIKIEDVPEDFKLLVRDYLRNQSSQTDSASDPHQSE